MYVSLQDLESAVVQTHTHTMAHKTPCPNVTIPSQRFMWVKMYTVIVIFFFVCVCVFLRKRVYKGAGPAAGVCLSLVCVTQDTDRRLKLVDARVPRP